ncbi:MAG: hypothetical protein NC402_06850 [Prevotella sp.]|nr:hypothetical protein [Prevotella sp.]MCM1075456.1 hypothetical protein [Ruminococcus sp.]
MVSIFFLIVLAGLCYAGKWVWDTYRTPRAKVNFEEYPVRGVDLSQHNGEVDFQKVAEDSISFVWLKASEGETITNKTFSENYTKAEKAGLAVGAYHFFRFDCDGVAQALNLCKVLEGRRPPMGVAIDVELENNAKGEDDVLVISRLESMVDYLDMRGLPVTIYTNKEGYSRFIKNHLENYPLWICSFRDYAPFDDDTPWTYWQYSHSGRVDGVKGKVDGDVYHGSAEGFWIMLDGLYE